ncbi:SMC family ATPase [Nocardia vinacea]|uniref:SMC family ATPase n=1 Tax=Nocardia vinacea TaxID=96468 RepID=UPI00344ACA98
MMPLTLSVTGFRSYPTPVTIDFTGKGLTAVLGDTGAGKSSILEAITYALFRSTTWDGRSTSQLIADKCDAMSVEFTFRHDGQRWRVHRTMHASNPNAGRHHLTNLDTGEEVDRATSVDTRIKSILGMGYDTFLRVGLLPQGKFDQLLVAPGKERTTRLRELFGADSLTEAREVARAQCERLTVLIEQAKAKRGEDNPAQIARDAGARAAASEARAAQLAAAITTISDLRERISTARQAAHQADESTRRLQDYAGSDPAAVLNELQPTVDRLAAEKTALGIRLADATAEDHDLTAQIAAREAEGDGVDALGRAGAVVDGLAARVADHRAARAAVADRDAQLAVEKSEIATAETELDQRVEQAEPLTAAADTADLHARTVRARAGVLRAGITTMTTAAAGARGTARAQRDAVDRLERAERADDDLTAEEAAVVEALAATDDAVAAVIQRNQAAAIATDLHPGDSCPVCHRELPEAFTLDSAATATELRDAKAVQREAQSRHQQFRDKQTAARAAVTGARDSVTRLDQDLRAAQQNTTDATNAAHRLLLEFSSLTGTFDAEAASTDLVAALTVLSETETETEADADLEQLTGNVTAAIADCEQAADNHARELHREATRHSAAIDSERHALLGRKDLHVRAQRQAAAESSRLEDVRSRIAADIETLPTHIRALLPDEILNIGPAETTAAATAVSDRLSEARQLAQARDTARLQLTTILSERGSLDQAVRTQIETPLNDLLRQLLTWSDSVSRTLTQHEFDHQVPPPPSKPDVGEVREFAAALVRVTDTLIRDLIAVGIGHQQSTDADTAQLRVVAGTLGDVDGFDSSADLTAPDALHPLVEAKATAITQANDQRAAEAAANARVKPAADLDFAIAAGRARLAAVEVLRRELVDARFLGHLTTRNTRALLGIASDLLGKMTGDRFGFAEEFEIVTRGTDVKHPAGRLSGGEKFLASLALALSLAELHSRSGPRLGSLFLDEGFATLDTDALESALDVLRTQAGSDRMVMVISHLHAVAEAVDDVLWVQRESAGSTAHWLTAAESDELVNSDLASGLQALT